MKTSDRISTRHQGSVLLDALVSVVVLAGGMAAVAALNTRLVSDGSLAKNRAQAIALAQDKIEEIRTNLINSGTSETVNNNFYKLEGGNDACGNSTYACGSAGFARAWSISNYAAIPGSVAKNITVTVRWTDAKDEGDEEQTVTVSSVVAWDEPAQQVRAVEDEDFEGLKSISPPTGGGNLKYSTPDLTGKEAKVATAHGDDFNLEVVEYENGVAVYDKDITGDQVWMTTDPGVIEIIGTIKLNILADEDPPDNFSNDPGEPLYFFDDNAYIKQSALRSIAADAGICKEKPSTDGTYLDYLCYVGSKWYGRVGVMAINESGMLENILFYSAGGGKKPDLLCPNTYRYGSNCDLTGQFTLTWTVGTGETAETKTKTYCPDKASKSPVFDYDEESVTVHSLTGEPMFYGTLNGQDFIIQNESVNDGICAGSRILSGTITISGDSTAGIVKNSVQPTVSGATSGCTVTQDSENIKVGTYRCSVGEDWTGILSFSASNCGTITPSSVPYTEPLADEVTTNNVTILGCVGNVYKVRGTVENWGLAFKPTIAFYSGGAQLDGVICDPISSGYECRNIPAGTTGSVVLDADNCDPPATAVVTNISGDVTDANVTGWDKDTTCDPVPYTIYGTVTNSGKWEVETVTGKTTIKEDITSLILKKDGASCIEANPITLPCPKDKGNYICNYTCKFADYPNEDIEITVHACPNDGAPCMISTPSSRQFTLPATQDWINRDTSFTVSPPPP